MGSIGKFVTDDMLGIVQYPDVKHAQAQYDQAYQSAYGQAQGAQQKADQGFGEAKGYRDQAGGLYNNLSQWGTGDRDAALQMLNRVLGEYGTTAGVSTPLGFTPGASAPTTNRTTPNVPGNAAAALNRSQAPGTPAPAPTPTTPAPATDAYALTDAQQVQANTQVDQINREKQSAIEELRARYAQAGITDPRAMEAGIQQIAERYDALASQRKASFAEDARANREKALGQAIDLFTNLLHAGTSTVAGAAGGLQSVGGQAQNYGEGQSQQAAQLLSALTSGAGNRLQATQQAANAYDADFLKLVGLAVTGGLSGGSPAAGNLLSGATVMPAIQGSVPRRYIA